MKKIFQLLAGLPKDIHAVNTYIEKGYTAWVGIYRWLYPNGPTSAELVVVEPVEAPPAQAEPAPAATAAVVL